MAYELGQDLGRQLSNNLRSYVYMHAPASEKRDLSRGKNVGNVFGEKTQREREREIGKKAGLPFWNKDIHLGNIKLLNICFWWHEQLFYHGFFWQRRSCFLVSLFSYKNLPLLREREREREREIREQERIFRTADTQSIQHLDAFQRVHIEKDPRQS